MLQTIRNWFWRVRLGLVEAEIQDVLEDMRDALHDMNLGVYRALADFHTELVQEAIQLRSQLGIR